MLARQGLQHLDAFALSSYIQQHIRITSTMEAVKLSLINIIERDVHKNKLTFDLIEKSTENFSKPAVFRDMVYIDSQLRTREFYEIELEKTLQWRRKTGNNAVSLRSKDGKSDYNYVTGQVGTGKEFLDDIFTHNLDVYSHLGTISSGFKDPYEWGKVAFNHLKEEIFRADWFDIPSWKVAGHMFFGYSSQEYGEPSDGAVGSDWHLFPMLNIFVMVAGRKKWMTRPPKLGDHLKNDSQLLFTSSGREAPGQYFDHEQVYVEPGDVLLNVPYEWHKVLNAKGLSIGCAFRVIDTSYISQLSRRPAIAENMPSFENDVTDDLAHLLTSVRFASLNLNRAQMMLNDIEYAYPALQSAGRKLKELKQEKNERFLS
jgi:hypothetical protein